MITLGGSRTTLAFCAYAASLNVPRLHSTRVVPRATVNILMLGLLATQRQINEHLLMSPASSLPAFLYASSCLPIGSARMRLPVAAKIALISAGANGGTPGSPTPLGGVSGPGGTM